MKYITLILAIILLISCGNDKIEISKEEYQKLKGVEPTLLKRIRIEDRVIDINTGSDGHDYMKLSTYVYWTDIHYIDCELCVKRNKKDNL